MNTYLLTHTTMTGSILQKSQSKTIQACSMLSAKQKATQWQGAPNQVSGKWKGNENQSVKTRGYALDARLEIQLLPEAPL